MAETQTQEERAAPSMVTIFGDGQEMDRALAAVFDSHGSSTHLVTTATGWLTSSDLVVARLDTQAGVEALRDLAQQDVRSSRIVCTCQEPESVAAVEDLAAVCSQCGEQHHVTLLWHPPIETPSVDHDGAEEFPGGTGHPLLAADLAEVVARELSVFIGPQFDQHSVSVNEDGETTTVKLHQP
ncbi:MAG: hypothetical protein M3Q98_00750 [Actinomycetota bacterium]|nr:hypothetical protein [Actinomycetota bacterium]